VGQVRLSIKAIIIRDGRLLVLKSRDAEGDWYMLPGGGQEAGETVPAALCRECLEEIGTSARLGRLRFVRDYIGKNHEFSATDDSHQVELMFECEIESVPTLGSRPDSMQTGIAWLELGELDRFRLYRRILRTALVADATNAPVYLGDVN
jgi:8-oxo-dGTP diphosphatase